MSNPMTLQNNEEELELRRKVIEQVSGFQTGVTSHSEVTDGLLELVEAYSHKKLLEAHITTRKAIALDNYHGHTFSEDADWRVKYDKFVTNNEKAIEALTQELEGSK